MLACLSANVVFIIKLCIIIFLINRPSSTAKYGSLLHVKEMPCNLCNREWTYWIQRNQCFLWKSPVLLAGLLLHFCFLSCLFPSCLLKLEWFFPLLNASAHKSMIRFTYMDLGKLGSLFSKSSHGNKQHPESFFGCLLLSFFSIYNFSLILEVCENADYILYA